MAERVGIERIAQTAKKFGIGITPKLPLSGVSRGLIPSKNWKKINKNPQKNQIDYVNWIELIKFKETRNYVQRVLENYNVYRYILEQKPIRMKNFFKDDKLY